MDTYYADQKLLEKDLVIGLAAMVMRRPRQNTVVDLVERFADHFRQLEFEEDDDLLEVFIQYLVYTCEDAIERDALVSVMKQAVSPELGDVAMTMMQREINESHAKGHAKGYLEGLEKTAKMMLREGLDLAFIVKLTGLSEEKLQKMASAVGASE